MRKSLLTGLLAVALIAGATTPLTKSHAAKPTTSQAGASAETAATAPATLPDYDIRLVGKGEFADYDLNAGAGKQAAAQSTTLRVRASAVDEFRASLAPDRARNLRAQLNEAGAVKNLFV